MEAIFHEDATARAANAQTSEASAINLRVAKLSLTAVVIAWIFYATVAELIWMVAPTACADFAGSGA